VLNHLQPNDVVIGSGSFGSNRKRIPPGAQILALRGPLTADYLGIDPSTVLYGDPGVLAPRILGIQKDASATTISVIPHYVDFPSIQPIVSGNSFGTDISVINVRRHPRLVIEDIASSRACVSTSLHGIIVAEALGIPAIWATVDGPIIGGTFKFRDYYLGTGRQYPSPLPLGEAIEAARTAPTHGFQASSADLELAFRRLSALLQH